MTRDLQRENARKRAWEHAPEQRSTCEICGVLLQAGSRTRGNHRCQPHERLYRRLRLAARRAVIEQMYRRGEPYTAIAARLGSTVNAVGVEMARMRNEGWDLPYRRPGWNRTAAA